MSTKLGVTENFVSSLYLLLIQSSTLKSVLSTVLTALATLLHVYIYIYIYLTNRFHVAVRLFSNRSQMTSKCGKNKKVAHEAQPSVSLMFLPHFGLLKGKSPQSTHQDLQTFKLLSCKGVVEKVNLDFKSFWLKYC